MPKAVDLEKLKKDIERWPKSWAGFNSDIPIGKRIVETMHQFLLAMVADQLAYTTINRHIDNLWLLGGEIIYGVNMDPELRDLDGRELLLRFVDEEGGPISRHLATEEEQKKFDGTCKRLCRFLTQSPGQSAKLRILTARKSS